MFTNEPTGAGARKSVPADNNDVNWGCFADPATVIDSFLLEDSILRKYPFAEDSSTLSDWICRFTRSDELQERWDWARETFMGSFVQDVYTYCDTMSPEALYESKNETFYHQYRFMRDLSLPHWASLDWSTRWFTRGGVDGLPERPTFISKEYTNVPEDVVVEAVLDTRTSRNLLSSLWEVTTTRQSVMSQLRGVLFLMIARGQIVEAHNSTSVPLFPSWEKVDALFDMFELVMFLTREWAVFVSLQFVNIVLSIGEWYYTMPQAVQCVFDLLIWMVVISISRNIMVKPTFEIKTRKSIDPNRFIGTRSTDGGIVYDVLIDGVRYALPAIVSSEVEHVEEMAMPGSEFHPSSKKPVGAILVSTAETDLQIFGVFWRYGDYLITARHVANALEAGTANFYLASVKENAKKNYVVGDVVPVDGHFFDMENNLVRDLTLDVFAVRIVPKLWAKIGVTSASVKLRSLYKQHVCAVGFVDAGLLVTSTGSTKEGSGPVELWHTASTRKGFSGSPLFCGNSVVGMHVGGSSARNVAIRMEVLVDALKYREESYSGEEEDVRVDRKFHGRSATLERLHDDRYAIMTSDGAVSFGWEEDEVRERFRNMWDLDEKDQDLAQDRKLDARYHSYYDGENAQPSVVEAQEQQGCFKQRCWFELPREKPGRGPKNPKLEPQINEWLNKENGELLKLGFEPEKFDYPDMSVDSEVHSLEKHLELFHERAETIVLPPTKVEMSRCAALVTSMLSANKFEPDVNYKTKDFIEELVNSTYCKPSKSSGYPHCANGLPNNEAVIRQFGAGGLAQLVLNEWEEKFFFKLFNKSEPTKKTKLDRGMQRVVVGFPVHKTLKHVAIFKNLATALSKNWELSPVKFGFVPGNPGHMESLARWLGKGEIVESDKTNWDYMCHGWVFEICRMVVSDLAVQPLSMGDNEWEAYQEDITGAFSEVFKECRIRTSNGAVYQPIHEGIMKSGWFLTIAVNSIAQIVVNTIVLMRYGCSDKYILEEAKIVAGGDDVLQRLPNINLDEYKEEAQQLGVRIEELKVLPGLAQGYEFFSHEIDFNRRDGHWRFKPVRFTKHIEHLRRVSLEDLPQALVSHMSNWRWQDRQFRFFERMFKSFRLLRPDIFEIRLLVSSKALRNKQLGYEGGDW